jgi:S-adenosylmethionine synthetase
MNRLVTSESVTGGHPDKLCDQISDGVLDAILAQDPDARVAVEAAAKDGTIWVFGETSTRATVDARTIVQDVLRTNGYTDPSAGITADTVGVQVSLSRQSPDIALGVDAQNHLAAGAGDQGLMIGYATREAAGLMPLPLYLARELTEALRHYREQGRYPWLRPDGKAQVTVQYEDGEPETVTSVVISTQHTASVSLGEVRETLRTIAERVIPEHLLTKDTAYHLNPTGRFVIGGPIGDAGLTGRKIIVDTYGGATRHGGGAFSGKDPSKVDRTGAYAARWLAKSIVDSGHARRAEIEIAYAIGVAQPVALSVQTFGGADDAQLEKHIAATIDLRPGAIIERLGLKSVKYQPCARGGHFGRIDLDLPWEQPVKI